MKLSREEVKRIALLARLGVSDDDVSRFQEQLSNILENFEALQKLDTADVPPTAQSIDLKNVFREDKVRPSLPVEEAMANAPRREENSFRVKPVLEE